MQASAFEVPKPILIESLNAHFVDVRDLDEVEIDFVSGGDRGDATASGAVAVGIAGGTAGWAVGRGIAQGASWGARFGMFAGPAGALIGFVGGAVVGGGVGWAAYEIGSTTRSNR